MTLSRQALQPRIAEPAHPPIDRAGEPDSGPERGPDAAAGVNGNAYAAFPFVPVNPGLAERPRHIQSLFEFWPPALFYAPVVAYWIWQGLRHRSLTLPTIANPLMELGGLAGESKTRQFASMTPEGHQWLAPYVSALRGPGDRLAETAAELMGLAAAARLDFPLVAKPDIGCQGAGVRIVRSEPELMGYLEGFPAGERLMLQRLIEWESEAGIFYVRRPGEAAGRIFSMTFKFFPYVIGDGLATLEQLIRRDPRAGRVPHLYLPRHRQRLGWVPAAGEKVRLVFAGNHCKGAVFRDASALVTPALTRRMDWLARSIPAFHFGRFDVRFASLPRLLEGEDFTVIEFNGGGSEAIHIWDPDAGLRGAYRALFAQIRMLFEFGAAHRAQGHVPGDWRELFRSWRREWALKRSYPLTE
jgi:hypothetical protein